MFRNKPLLFFGRFARITLQVVLLFSLLIPQMTVKANPGSSLAFDGNTDYVYIGETRTVLGNTAWVNTMSFSLWVKPSSTGFCTVSDVAQCDSIIGDRPRWWGLSQGTVSGLNRLWVWNYDGNYDRIGIPYTPGEWLHVAWVHANGVLKAYKNGELVGSVPSGMTVQPNTGAAPKLQIGAVINNSIRNWSFQGELDEVRIYDLELSQAIIQSTLFTELNGYESGLRAYYKMSNGAGLTLTDDSSNAFDGQLRDGIPNVTDGTVPFWSSSTAFDRPLARDINQTINEDTSVQIPLLGQGMPGVPLTYTATNPLTGSIQIEGSNLTFTPALHFLGVETFTYQAWANGIASAPATVRITVIGGNDAPIANNLSLNLPEDSNVNGVLVASDLENDPLTFSIVSQPSHGTLSGTLPNFTYTPNLNYFGMDSFSFKANDSLSDSNVATVSFTIQPVNDIPVADSKEITTTSGTPVSVPLTGSDIENDPLNFDILSNPLNGSLTGIEPNLTYTPNNGFIGLDNFTYAATDSLASSSPATVTIVVTAGNQAPLTNNLSTTTDEDIESLIVLSGSDPESQPLSYTILSQPTHGTLFGSAPNLSYRPNANFNGSDSFSFKVNDGQIDSNNAIVSITVNAVNDRPLANNLSINTTANQSIGINLTGSDIENSPLTFDILSIPLHGILTGTPPNLSYMPATNYSGSDSFTYRVNDGALDSVEATVNISVSSGNLPPIANGQNLIMAEDTTISILLSGSDPEGFPISFSFLSPPTRGSLFGSVPNMTYDPIDNFNGADYFVFRVWDGVQWSPGATINIQITPVNDTPRALSQSVQMPKNTFLDIQLTGTDVDGDLISYSIFSSPLNGTLGAIDPITKIVRYTPNSNFTGTDYFRFVTSDGSLTSRPATISLTVTN